MQAHDRDTGWSEVADALRAGRIAGLPAGEVSCHETHGSLVAVIGDSAFKLKRPVTFDAFDYGSRAARKAMCLREIEVNRPLGGDIYRGVRGVKTVGPGFALCENNDPAALEHLVVMRRVAPAERLDQQVVEDAVRIGEISALGSALAVFHRQAARGPDDHGVSTLRTWCEQRVNVIRRAPPCVLPVGKVDAAVGFLRRWIERNDVLFEERAAAGHVRLGHGDLRLEHVVPATGTVIDALEFDDAIRTQDVLADLSFLAMELHMTHREDLTRILIDAWAAAGGPLHIPLLWFYAFTKALVRVEVGVDGHAGLDAGLSRRIAEERMQRHLDGAIELSWRARVPRAIVFGGLSGSGKTTISASLADRWALERLSSDETRKRFAGLGHDDTAGPAAYEERISRQVYAMLGRQAGRAVAGGRSIVVDATFRRSVDAAEFVRAYRGEGATTTQLVIECIASDDVLRDRIRERVYAGGSDATIDVLEDQIHERPLYGLGVSNAIPLLTDAPHDEALDQAERLVLAHTV